MSNKYLKYAQDWFDDIPHDGINVWYIGVLNTLDEGINALLNNLNVKGYILIEEPEIFDFISLHGIVVYIVYYKALSKLEYLEYKYKEKVNKNVHRSK